MANNLFVTNLKPNVNTNNNQNLNNNVVFQHFQNNTQTQDTYEKQNNDNKLSNKTKWAIGVGIAAVAAGVLIWLGKAGKLGKAAKNVTNNVPTPVSTPKVRQMSEKGIENLKKHLVNADEVSLYHNFCYKDGKLYTGKVLSKNKILKYVNGKRSSIYEITETQNGQEKLITVINDRYLKTPISVNSKLYPKKVMEPLLKEYGDGARVISKKVLSNGNTAIVFKDTPECRCMSIFDKNGKELKSIEYTILPDSSHLMFTIKKCVSLPGNAKPKWSSWKLFPDKNGKWRKVPDKLLKLSDKEKADFLVREGWQWDILENGQLLSEFKYNPCPKVPKFFYFPIYSSVFY